MYDVGDYQIGIIGQMIEGFGKILPWFKVFLLKWIYKTNKPPCIRIGYDGYFIYSDRESMNKFMTKHDLFPKVYKN
jgi:hypothetical protein